MYVTFTYLFEFVITFVTFYKNKFKTKRFNLSRSSIYSNPFPPCALALAALGPHWYLLSRRTFHSWGQPDTV